MQRSRAIHRGGETNTMAIAGVSPRKFINGSGLIAAREWAFCRAARWQSMLGPMSMLGSRLRNVSRLSARGACTYI